MGGLRDGKWGSSQCPHVVSVDRLSLSTGLFKWDRAVLPFALSSTAAVVAHSNAQMDRSLKRKRQEFKVGGGGSHNHTRA